ncbi:MAG: hypothetical protein AAF560_32255, partial [Acidobacteriota bacterium]
GVSENGGADTGGADRWHSCLDRCGLSDPEGQLLAELEALYAEPHRKYHNLQHVLDCLGHLESIPIEGADTEALELAFWFHDAIYSPFKGDNEQASADLAINRLSALGAGVELRDKVHRLIMVTTHDATPRDVDESVMIDIDLAILGSAQEIFEAYETNIRREYKLVPGPLFRRKRKAILESFLARPAIYHTEVFRHRLEAAARSNLQWAISRL